MFALAITAGRFLFFVSMPTATPPLTQHHEEEYAEGQIPENVGLSAYSVEYSPLTPMEIPKNR
jgi:hypothetical protein